MKRKILAITGIRSEYDILYPVIDALRKDEAFEVKLVVCSAHLSAFHVYTLRNIEDDGFVIADRIDSLFSTDREVQRSKGTGMLIYALSQTVEREKPDFLLVVGDREESIATAIVGNYMNVLTVHIGGGDPVFGNADDPVRMAVSKIAHMHFTLAKPYAENLIRMSEDPYRVHFCGNPSLENIRNVPAMQLDELSGIIGMDITDGRYIVLVKHPLSSEYHDAGEQYRITLDALHTFCLENNYKVVASYPNTDPGAEEIHNSIAEYEHLPHFRFNRTLPRLPFINLLRNARALAGNSSMGILEAPFYKLPAVNIGNRQQGRLNAGNVKFVDHEKAAIIKALKQACFDETYRAEVASLDQIYGDGYASERILKILKDTDPRDPSFLIKKNLC